MLQPISEKIGYSPSLVKLGAIPSAQTILKCLRLLIDMVNFLEGALKRPEKGPTLGANF